MYQKLTDGHLFSDHLENGEVFSIGGDYLGGSPIQLIADYDSFGCLFSKMSENAKQLIENTGFKDWYDKLNVDFDYSIFCHMLSFNSMMKKHHPDIIMESAIQRTVFYSRSGTKKLSEAVAAKQCACTEYAILAQAYFQKQNIPTRYVGGELVSNGDFGDFEPHSFIAFKNNGKDYIYDPVNPHIYTGVDFMLPRISECVGNKDKYFIDAKALFKKEEFWYYACGDKGCFLHNLPTKKPEKAVSNAIVANITANKR